MSSRSPTGPDRRRPVRALALFLGLLAAQLPAPAAQAAPSPSAPSRPAAAPQPVAAPLPVAAVLTGGGQSSLVVDLGASARSAGRTVAVTRDGVPQAARLVPVMSAGLAVALVVDTSAAGARALPAWLSAAARFILEAPAGTRSVVIAAGTPAAAVSQPQRGPAEVVRALDGIRAGTGGRDTAAALDLAARQFPDAPAGRRVAVLYTTAPDAGGESAAALGARLRASGTILVVVGTADASPFWPDAAAATGGFFAPAGDPVVVPALDQVQTTLRGRHLVTFPTPPTLPARVSVRIDTADLRLAGEATIPAPPPAAERGGRGWAAVRLGATAAGVFIVLAAIVLVLRGRRTGEPAGPSGGPAVARGRAQVPGAVARGRAAVPKPGDPDGAG